MPQITDIFEAVALVKTIAKSNGAHASVSVYFDEDNLPSKPSTCGTLKEEVEEVEEVEDTTAEDEAAAKKAAALAKRRATAAAKKKAAEEEEDEDEEEYEEEIEEEEEVKKPAKKKSTLTLKTLTPKVLSAAKEYGKPSIKALLDEFGIEKLGELDAAYFGEFADRLEEECP